ncbi:MAG: flagellar basal body rod protein FlgF [Psychromonas sp.]|nr:flagellar basal body rod protein FlgF [Psychromonas sp.]
MDKFLYIAMSGAKESMNAVSIHSNNISNARTTAFKSSYEQARSMQAFGDGLPTRVFAVTESPGENFESGLLRTTGRDLDVAIQGEGWFVVESKQNDEGMTRSGEFRIDPEGYLIDISGNRLIYDNDFPIQLPLPIEKLNIRSDGIVEVRPEGAPSVGLEEIGRLKLVDPPLKDLIRGSDGLFRMNNGGILQESLEVSIMSGALENSNVNLSSELTSLINLQRQFEIQIKMMKHAEEMDRSSDSLLRI